MKKKPHACAHAKPYLGMPPPEGGRKECLEGGSFVNCVREQASKRAMGGRRSKIPNSRYRVGGGYRSSYNYQTPPCRVGCAPCGCYTCGTQHHPSCIAPRCLCRRSKPVPKSRRKKINNIILSASPPLSLNVFVALAEKPQLGQEMRMEQKLQSNRTQFTLQHFNLVSALSLPFEPC